MNRIFPVLVLLALAMLAAAMAAGFLVELPAADFAGNASADTATREAAARSFRLHFFLGIAAALVVMLVHGIVTTYFIGTSRWCKEVVLAYGLEETHAARSAQLKRRAFPFTVTAMLTMVAIVSLGAAADPATHVPPLWESIPWSQVHLGAVLGGIALMALVHFVQWTAIVENQQIIAALTEQVRTRRREKGLPT